MNNQELINYAKVKINEQTGEVKEKTTEEVLENQQEIVERQLENQVSLYAGSGVVENAIKENKAIEKIIENVLVENTHYGIVPGTSTKTLLQPGADVLAKTYGVEIRYELVDKTYDPANHLLDYEYKAVAYWRGKQIGEALASANTQEQKFKSHFWDIKKDEPKAGKSIFDIKNTIQQMAQKRAMVRVVRKVFAITGAFTQDMEDIGVAATKDDKMSIYQELYMYKTADMGKNDTDRKNWMKLNVLKPIVDLVCEGRGFSKWVRDDISKINDKLQDRAFVENLIKEAKNV